MEERDITKRMLDKLREGKDKQAREAAEQFVVESKEEDNFLTRSKTLMEEAVKNNKKKVLTEAEAEEESSDESHDNYFEIRPNTPQFGDVRTSQEDVLKKTIGENIMLDEGALKYYPDSDDMTLEGKIRTLNMEFQFRYNDPSGDGVYVWTEAMQLTETNTKTLGKIRNAFLNWKDSITQDGDLMMKLKKAANKEK
ncbi:MAG: hypothetical protein J6O49_22005 [Bacteroidaceae bacterium]|nr:hypothetical protein [Bacteroidaceae bacterium]